MISIILGEKGSGKTKAFINSVNQAAVSEAGNTVCITKGSRYMFDVDSSVRLVNTSDFDLDSYKVFYGFLCGIISRDYDITHIFIDSVTKIVNSDLEKLTVFLGFLESLAKGFNIKFTITISAPLSAATDAIKKYLIEF